MRDTAVDLVGVVHRVVVDLIVDVGLVVVVVLIVVVDRDGDGDGDDQYISRESG